MSTPRFYNLIEQLLTGQQDEAWNVFDSFINKTNYQKALVPILMVLTDAMRHIGELWERNLITVADEHMASQACLELLTR